jgi:hypothetical protein
MKALLQSHRMVLLASPVQVKPCNPYTYPLRSHPAQSQPPKAEQAGRLLAQNVSDEDPTPAPAEEAIGASFVTMPAPARSASSVSSTTGGDPAVKARALACATRSEMNSTWVSMVGGRFVKGAVGAEDHEEVGEVGDGHAEVQARSRRWPSGP